MILSDTNLIQSHGFNYIFTIPKQKGLRVISYIIERLHCDLFSEFSFGSSCLRLPCLDITFKHTSDLLRSQGFQKKYKRPTKVVKAKPKAREPKMLDF